MTARALLAMALTACAYDAHFEDCAIQCSIESGCPDGLVCKSEGLCRIPESPETCAAVLHTFPSCVSLAKTCGPTQDDDCCSTAEPIPGGTFYRSYDVAADGMYPSMAYPATVSPFLLDRFEVTVGRFRKFVEAGGGTQTYPPASGTGSRRLNGTDAQGGWDSAWDVSLVGDEAALVSAVKCDASFQTWTDAAGTNEGLPINCVTWYEAFAFCAWDGGFLSTEAEWNFAAAGGGEQRAYPWSSPPGSTTIDCSYANYYPNSTSPCVKPNGAVNHVGNESPKGDGKWGQSDLGGNVWEWILDWATSPYGNPCEDCADLTPSPYRVIHGGDFYFDASYVRGAYRLPATPDHRDIGLGMRCARKTRS